MTREAGPEIRWELTTWEGSRREQLRRWRELPLREKLAGLEEMAALADRLRQAPKVGGAGIESKPDRPPSQGQGPVIEGHTVTETESGRADPV